MEFTMYLYTRHPIILESQPYVQTLCSDLMFRSYVQTLCSDQDSKPWSSRWKPWAQTNLPAAFFWKLTVLPYVIVTFCPWILLFWKCLHVRSMYEWMSITYGFFSPLLGKNGLPRFFCASFNLCWRLILIGSE